MHVFQTAGEPPSNGNNILPNIGCSTNMSAALANKVNANNKISEKLRSAVVLGDCFIIIVSVQVAGKAKLLIRLS
jgi:hypothetical protein